MFCLFVCLFFLSTGKCELQGILEFISKHEVNWTVFGIERFCVHESSTVGGDVTRLVYVRRQVGFLL